MTDYEVKLVAGSLLHDIGKVVFRQGDDQRNHSVGGYEYLKTEAGIEDEDILNCVRFHHSALLKGANVAENAMCYIVYMADNIAAAADRRTKDDGTFGFEKSMPLQSIFNILNGNEEKFYYRPGMLDAREGVNFPQEEKEEFTQSQYGEIKRHLTENLKTLKWSGEYINSLLEVMEANLTYIPSSTSMNERADISLYDHVKLTAALASCISRYVQEKNTDNLKEYLFVHGKDFEAEEAFLLFSMDISGIQKFIYTIATKKALRTLRARSFYLEILMEHMIDSLLEKNGLSRANLIYSGGGHCYLLLPNTENVKKAVDDYLEEMNTWFREQFGTALYVAGAYEPCSSLALQNRPQGSYSQIYRNLGRKISKKKLNRYTAQEIISLNNYVPEDYTRECSVCKRPGKVDEEGVCDFCRKMEQLSKYVLYGRFFSVLKGETEEGVPLPGNCTLVCDNEDEVKKRMENDSGFVRVYAKNEMFSGKHIATKLWVGDYTTGQSFEEFAKEAKGIERIGVLRADVDNLGEAFVFGFENEKNADKYVTLSRTAVLSRQLSCFFKLYIRNFLENGTFDMEGGKKKAKRKATIIYSGGDDVFIVGCWEEILELAVDLKKGFEKYTQGTLTISAGIGFYESGYPISVIAEETGEMEEQSKHHPGKNSVTLFEDGEHHCENGIKIGDGTWNWEEFEEEVIKEKFQTISRYITNSEERGMSFIYHLLDMIRNRKEKINFARAVYLLSRLEPREEGPEKERYQEFSSRMFQWLQNEKDCRQLKTAIQIYVYLHREKEGAK